MSALGGPGDCLFLLAGSGAEGALWFFFSRFSAKEIVLAVLALLSFRLCKQSSSLFGK